MQPIRDPSLIAEATCVSCGTRFSFYPREAKGRYCGAASCMTEQKREAGRARALQRRLGAYLARPQDNCFNCGRTFRPRVNGGGASSITCSPECGAAFRSWGGAAGKAAVTAK